MSASTPSPATPPAPPAAAPPAPASPATPAAAGGTAAPPPPVSGIDPREYQQLQARNEEMANSLKTMQTRWDALQGVLRSDGASDPEIPPAAQQRIAEATAHAETAWRAHLTGTLAQQMGARDGGFVAQALARDPAFAVEVATGVFKSPTKAAAAMDELKRARPWVFADPPAPPAAAAPNAPVVPTPGTVNGRAPPPVAPPGGVAKPAVNVKTAPMKIAREYVKDQDNSRR